MRLAYYCYYYRSRRTTPQLHSRRNYGNASLYESRVFDDGNTSSYADNICNVKRIIAPSGKLQRSRCLENRSRILRDHSRRKILPFRRVQRQLTTRLIAKQKQTFRTNNKPRISKNNQTNFGAARCKNTRIHPDEDERRM